jgi:SAM-dependent methyltransferase
MYEFLNPSCWKYKEKYYIRIELDTDTKFSDEQQDGLFGIEDGSWWFNYRSDVIISLLNRYFDKDKLVIDVGGGNGFTTSKAKNAGFNAVLMEPSPAACRHAYMRGISDVFIGTMDDEGIMDESIEQIMLLDVLEHIKDDKMFLNNIYNKLKVGGVMLITVPSSMRLWSSEDVEAGHFRRYTRKNITKLAREAGFEILYSNYFMEFLYLPVLLVRVGLEKIGFVKERSQRTKEEQEKITKAQFEKKSGFVGTVLNMLEMIELKRLEKNRKVRFGSSVILILKK